MLIVVLDYTDGSVHFHRVPNGIEDVMAYLEDNFGYTDKDAAWMEVLV